jgi:ABC-type Fe3+/spermidine/putrescine transport system ATPase subunit
LLKPTPVLHAASGNVASLVGRRDGGGTEPVPPPAESAIRLHGVTKSFGDELAVRGIDLQVRRGEVFAILGPSGSGKSTTLRMIAGLEHPDRGLIVSGERVMSCSDRNIFVPPRRRNMGMVFQSYAMWPHLSVFETIAYPLRVRRRSRQEIETKVIAALELVGLSGFERRRAASLSGGQQQRVALARALVYEPDVLLLDEPFSSLDLKLREQLRIELKLLQRRLRITVILVTHDQVEALTLADRIAVMRGGIVEQVGDPRAIYECPSSEFVRDFVGRSVIFPARVIAVRPNGDVRVDMLGATIDVPQRNAPKGVDVAEPVSLSLRPEDIRIETGSAPAELLIESERALDGEVRTVLFSGDRTECVVAVGGFEFEAFVDRNARIAERQPVRIVLPGNAMRLWRGTR